MDTKYSFAVLRYVHDVVTGEFVNVGLVFHAPEPRILRSKCVDSYRRISTFFPNSEGAHIRRMLRFVEEQIEMLSERLSTELVLDSTSQDFLSLLNDVIPKDDSALQFSTVCGGLTRDPLKTFATLYQRYVGERSTAARRSRTDEEVLRVFRNSLLKKQVLERVAPKKIAGEHYSHEFPIAWKNGFWHTSEAVSFDLQDPIEILEKANRWLGRAHSLKASGEKFKLHLLVGAPTSDQFQKPFAHARNILETIPVDHQLVLEDEADDFAEYVARDIHLHDSQSKK